MVFRTHTPIMHSIHTNFFTECPPPPNSNFSSTSIEFTYFEGEYWTFTEVSYTCDPDYTFLPGEVDRRVCGVENEDGVWDNYTAPVCAPGL